MPKLLLIQLTRQEFEGNNAAFSAGAVEGHEVDTLYLKLEREGEEPITILLRADEAASLIWCLSGALWSELDRRTSKGA